MKIKNIILIFLIIMSFNSINVYASKYINNIFITNLNTKSNILENETEIVVTIGLDVTYNLKVFLGKLNYDKSKLEFLKCESDKFVCTVKDNIVLDSIEGIKGKNEVAKLYFKKTDNLKKGENTNISISEIEGDNNVISKDVSINIHVLEDNTNLEQFNVLNETLVPSFNENITSYKITTKNDKIIFDGKSVSKIFGLGEKTLMYGNNIFEIKVLSEIGTEKTYIINVFRIKEENIDNQVENDKEITKDDTTNNNANKENIKNNSSVIRQEKSTNKNLRYLRIKGVELKFNKNIFEYTINLRKELKKIEFEYELEDKRSKVFINGDTIIKGDSGTIFVSIIAEDGSKLDYKFNISCENTNELIGVDSVTDNKEQQNDNNKDNSENKLPTNILTFIVIAVSLIFIIIICFFKIKKISKNN